MDLKVSRLFVYPIKSCGAFEVNEWQLEPYGFQYDRSWAVVSDSGLCMTQLQEPKLCLVRPQIDLQKGTMTLVYADNEDKVPMTVPLDTKDNTKLLGTICWGGALEGIDCGDEVATWLSWNIDRPGLRLIRCTERIPPNINKYGNLDPKVLGANQCQYLLTTHSTLKWLQREMENDITEIDEDNLLLRFRGNIVISGKDLPIYAELEWTNLDIGDIQFQQDSVCERCKMVNIDQDTSENYYKPLSILAQHKWQGKIVFGIYLKRCNTQICKIQVGQQCVVIGK